MKCSKFEYLISIENDESLTDRQARKLSQHLIVCARCRDFRGKMLQTTAGLQSLVDDASKVLPTGNFDSRLHSSLEEELYKRREVQSLPICKLLHWIYNPQLPTPLRLVPVTLTVLAVLALILCFTSSMMKRPINVVVLCPTSRMAAISVETGQDGRVYAKISERNSCNCYTPRGEVAR